MEKYTISRLSKEFEDIKYELENNAKADDTDLYEAIRKYGSYVTAVEHVDYYFETMLTHNKIEYEAVDDVNILKYIAEWVDDGEEYILTEEEIHSAVEFCDFIKRVHNPQNKTSMR